MPRILAIHWNQQQAQVVVVNPRTAGTTIEAVVSIALTENSSSTEIGEQLAEALAPYLHGRFQTLIGIDREFLQWQSLNLPPAPTDELPDLVRLQADRSMNLAEGKTGLDFLPFAGDENTPHEVLAFGISADQWKKIHHIAITAGVKINHLVPLETGWVARMRQTLAKQSQRESTKSQLQLYVALQSDRAILWAILDEQFVLLRSLHMPAQTLICQLKRTLLALQTSHPNSPVAAVWITGDWLLSEDEPQTDEFRQLDQQLHLPVHFIDCHEAAPAQEEAIHPATIPLTGLAHDAAHRREPLVDLLHPRQSTTAHANQRTHLLLATSMICLLAWITWHGYQNIRLPQQAAEAANLEATLLQETGDTYLADLQQAAVIGRWTASRIDLLDQLERLSINLRPHALDAKDFSASEDLVLMSLNLQRRQFDLNAVAANLNGVGALETRLRTNQYLVQRDNTNLKSTLKNYDWPFRIIVQVPEQLAIPQNHKENQESKEDQLP